MWDGDYIDENWNLWVKFKDSLYFLLQTCIMLIFVGMVIMLFVGEMMWLKQIFKI